MLGAERVMWVPAFTQENNSYDSNLHVLFFFLSGWRRWKSILGVNEIEVCKKFVKEVIHWIFLAGFPNLLGFNVEQVSQWTTHSIHFGFIKPFYLDRIRL